MSEEESHGEMLFSSGLSCTCKAPRGAIKFLKTRKFRLFFKKLVRRGAPVFIAMPWAQTGA